MRSIQTLPRPRFRDIAFLVGLPALALLGCGEGLTDTNDVQQVAGDVTALGAPPDAASTIAFQTFTDDVGKQAASKTRTLIRSARGYQSFFGHAPPAAVDFSREWVMFYSAGTEPTGGYEASFVALLRNGSSLIAITKLVSPGSACVVDDLVNTPFALIKFPAQPGTSAQFYKSDVVTDCVVDPCSYIDCGPGSHCEKGQCVVSCGGLIGAPCPGQGKCGDDPNDGCDPAAGGADCPGVCSCVQTQACTTNSKFNSDPAVCACVPVCGPVCAIYCDYGNVLDANGCPTCSCNPPPSDPCATVKCAAGTHCDAGKCVSNGVSCGGIAGIPCPGVGKCADDPNDSCDPAKGGADCGGICSCVDNVLCTTNSHFDSSPSVCACVPNDPNPCPPEKCPTPSPKVASMICADGTTAGPTCVPDATGVCGWTITKCPSP
jgi:hypothetical protein